MMSRSSLILRGAFALVITVVVGILAWELVRPAASTESVQPAEQVVKVTGKFVAPTAAPPRDAPDNRPPSLSDGSGTEIVK